jgi:hypothetical protein
MSDRKPKTPHVRNRQPPTTPCPLGNPDDLRRAARRAAQDRRAANECAQIVALPSGTSTPPASTPAAPAIGPASRPRPTVRTRSASFTAGNPNVTKRTLCHAR